MRQFPVMLFAAGLGTRMGALTQDRPKPLIRVTGRTLLDRAIDLVDCAGFQKRVINVHYRGDQIVQHLVGRDVVISPEHDTILETGGGLRAAMPLLGGSPVVTLNTDAVWTTDDALRTLARAWVEDRMDALLLLAPASQALGYVGSGDFVLEPSGRIARAKGRPGMVYLGAQIIRTDLLPEVPEPVFSLNLLWDRMISAGRAYGLVYSGQWCDVGRPEGIALAEAMLAKSGHD